MSARIIETTDDLDTFVEELNAPYVVAVDVHGRPWIIYATEDDMFAVSFPVERDDGTWPQVEVGDMLVSIDALDLPLEVVFDPEAVRLGVTE